MKFFKSRNRGQVGRGRQGYQECSVKCDTQLALKRQRHETNDVKGRCGEVRKFHVTDWKWGLGVTLEVVRKSEREGGSGAGWKRTLRSLLPELCKDKLLLRKGRSGATRRVGICAGPDGRPPRPAFPRSASTRALRGRCQRYIGATGPPHQRRSAARPRGRRRAPRPTCWLPPQPRPPRSSAHLTLEL